MGTAAFALTAGTAWDEGGFHAVACDRALTGLAALALACGAARRCPAPRPPRRRVLGALAFLTAWTAASWLWSDSPPAALDEAQRVAAYLAAAVAVAVAGRRVPPVWIAGGVAAGIVPPAAWNLAVRLAPDWTGQAPQRADIGALADTRRLCERARAPRRASHSCSRSASRRRRPRTPLRAAAAVLLVPFAADLALQQSTGADAALAAGLVALVLVAPRGPRRRLARAARAAACRGSRGRAGEQRRLAVAPGPRRRGGSGHRLLLALVLLAAAQLAVALLLVPRLAGGGRHAAGARRRRRRRAAARRAASPPLRSRCTATCASGYWRVALREYRADPVLGSGAGTFVDWWLRTRTAAHSTQEAHSLYVETAAELGPARTARACSSRSERRSSRRCGCARPRWARHCSRRSSRTTSTPLPTSTGSSPA